jgi:hypothetical protein
MFRHLGVINMELWLPRGNNIKNRFLVLRGVLGNLALSLGFEKSCLFCGQIYHILWSYLLKRNGICIRSFESRLYHFKFYVLFAASFGLLKDIWMMSGRTVVPTYALLLLCLWTDLFSICVCVKYYVLKIYESCTTENSLMFIARSRMFVPQLTHSLHTAEFSLRS